MLAKQLKKRSGTFPERSACPITGRLRRVAHRLETERITVESPLHTSICTKKAAWIRDIQAEASEKR